MMFRERILSQINVILQSVESIVSQLQEVRQYPNDEEQLWWDCQHVQLQCQSISQEDYHENCSYLETSSEINNNIEDEEARCAVSDNLGPLCSFTRMKNTLKSTTRFCVPLSRPTPSKVVW